MIQVPVLDAWAIRPGSSEHRGVRLRRCSAREAEALRRRSASSGQDGDLHASLMAELDQRLRQRLRGDIQPDLRYTGRANAGHASAMAVATSAAARHLQRS